MPLDKIETLFSQKLKDIDDKGLSKRHELVITGRKAPENGWGSRFYLNGYGDQAFLRMNSNSYLGLEINKQVVEAESHAAEQLGTGPGAVRFISGTYQQHQQLEQKLAQFHNREAAIIFSAAYAGMLGVLPQLIDENTLVVSDALNHNCIINAIRLSHCGDKKVYAHLDMQELENILQSYIGQYQRVCVVSDGVFSMRGDYAPLDQIQSLCDRYHPDYQQGVISIIDDSHGVGAFGATGRGTEEICQVKADLLIATLGKAFAVNGGYAVASQKVIDYLKESAALYIYSNPITPAEAAAAKTALDIVDSKQGIAKLQKLRDLSDTLRTGLQQVGFQTIPGQHPIVPILIKNTEKTQALVRYLFEHKILVTGLSYPVVPKGQEEIRLQVSADHTEKDIELLLSVLSSQK